MKLYNTVLGQGSAQQIIEKSRFIAYVAPVQNREEAESFIETIKKKHKDATHNVPAMVIGDKSQIQWASDDGEPQGTSGAPIVQMLVSENITNVVVVVTRYFGGIKLGTGGLVRAYTSSAKLGLSEAKICEVKEMASLKFKVDYAVFNKIQNYNYEFDERINDIIYTDNVTFNMIVSPENRINAESIINNISNGTGILLEAESTIDKVKI